MASVSIRQRGVDEAPESHSLSREAGEGWGGGPRSSTPRHARLKPGATVAPPFSVDGRDKPGHDGLANASRAADASRATAPLMLRVANIREFAGAFYGTSVGDRRQR